MNDQIPKLMPYIGKSLTSEQVEELEALAMRDDGDIDFSDMPNVGADSFVTAKRGTMYRALKAQLTIRLDADVLAWFKQHAKNGKGYQSDINAVLRNYVAAQRK